MTAASNQFFCFSCGAIFIAKDEIALSCPDCGFSYDIHNYRKILNYALKVTRFGYCYRRRYEINYDETFKHKIRYYLGPIDQILIFIGVAAISGIIGGASYDLVKRIRNKIRRQLSGKRQVLDENCLRLLNDEKEFRIFLKYIEQFCEGMDEIPAEVGELIVQEIYIDKMSKAMIEKMREYKKSGRKMDSNSFKEIVEEIARSAKEITDEDIPVKDDFDGLWNML
jgi:hypothetical protein